MTSNLAYHDTFAGLVPCRIVAVSDWTDSECEARIQYTATRGAYKRGEYNTLRLRYIVPRTAAHIRGEQYRIYPYSWK